MVAGSRRSSFSRAISILRDLPSGGPVFSRDGKPKVHGNCASHSVEGRSAPVLGKGHDHRAGDVPSRYNESDRSPAG
jgi:hypothetical protein